LEGIGAGSGLEGTAAKNHGSCFPNRGGDAHDLLSRLDRAGTGNDCNTISADLHLADGNNGILFFQLTRSKFIRFADGYDTGHSLKQLNFTNIEGALADCTEDSLFLPNDFLDGVAFSHQKGPDRLFLQFADLFFQYDYHENTLERNHKKVKGALLFLLWHGR